MKIVDQLIAGGTIDSRGAFTVDAEKAREKIERFRLADPLAYVVELVQAAVLVGARRIDIDVDADDFCLRCDGSPFSRADLTDLESAVLVRSPDESPARQQLALDLGPLFLVAVRLLIVVCGPACLCGCQLESVRCLVGF